VTTDQCLAIEFFAMRLAILPATKQNPNPLESQSTYHVMWLALGALLLLVRFGPNRGTDGVRSPLMKGLSEKREAPPSANGPSAASSSTGPRKRWTCGLAGLLGIRADQPVCACSSYPTISRDCGGYMTVSRCGKLTHMSHDQIWSKLTCHPPRG
jgi:hypothetical protein